MVFHKFSQIAGRVVPTSTNAAYMPQGLAATPADSGTFKFDSSATKKVPVSSTHSVPAAGAGPGAAKGVIPASSGYQNIVQLQKAFALNDGLMVWQKRGMRDKLPMWITFAMMGVGMAICVSNLYKMSFPPKTEE